MYRNKSLYNKKGASLTEVGILISLLLIISISSIKYFGTEAARSLCKSADATSQAELYKGNFRRDLNDKNECVQVIWEESFGPPGFGG